MIAYSFFTLAGYVTFESIHSLLGSGDVDQSTIGTVLASVSLAVMPVLSRPTQGRSRTRPSTAVADSKQILLCTYLSAVLLVGLVLNRIGTTALTRHLPSVPWNSESA